MCRFNMFSCWLLVVTCLVVGCSLVRLLVGWFMCCLCLAVGCNKFGCWLVVVTCLVVGSWLLGCLVACLLGLRVGWLVVRC